MVKNNPIQKLETLRGELEISKGAFAELLGVSRMWYDLILNDGKTIDLKTLSGVSRDQVGTPLGQLAVDLIVAWHGAENVPCVCQTELGDAGPCPKHGDVTTFLEFLEGCNEDDLIAVAPVFSKEQKQILKKFIHDRNERQFKVMKAQNRTGVAA